MKVIINGNDVSVLGENEIIVKDSIPVGCYDVVFNKMSGNFLKLRDTSLKVKEKIYGNHISKADKAFNAFNQTDRSLGVLLSGNKGIGKTIFVNIIAEKALEKGLPVIICSENVPNLSRFLSSITQEVVVIFDEFEKNFKDYNDDDDDNSRSEQTELLSLFDGLSGTKKMFLVTCNNVNNINPFFLNRPGRFHYHFKLKNPNAQEIREYLIDHLKPEYHNDIIDRIINFACVSNMTYDWLRAISFEINCGSSLEDAIEDLNISASSEIRYNFNFIIEDTLYSGYCFVKVGYDYNYILDLYSTDSLDKFRIKFNSKDIYFKDDKLRLDKIASAIKVSSDGDCKAMFDTDKIELVSIIPEDKKEKIKTLKY